MTERVLRLVVALPLAALAVTGCGGSDAASPTVAPSPPTKAAEPIVERTIPKRRSLVCTLRPGVDRLPASRRHGLIDHLLQYPDVSLATRGELARARRVLASLESAARAGHWSDPQAAKRAGYDPRTLTRKAGDRSIHYLHAERHQERRGRILLNPRRPKALIYANAPGRKLALVGAMWSMRRDELGPTPGGPITRWHSHVICVKPGKRGIIPPKTGCPKGMKLRQGRSEMMHVWFTKDLRSAFAIRAPEPELCRDGLLPRSYCAGVEGRAVARPDVSPIPLAVEAFFQRESYRPGDEMRLELATPASDLRVQVFHSGPEHVRTTGPNTMRGVPVTREIRIGAAAAHTTVRLEAGRWPSGVYFARLLDASSGRGGFAPFVLRPRRLGEHRVAVVVPTVTWQAYNFRDGNGDGTGDTWYADSRRVAIRLDRPYFHRGVPFGFRQTLPFFKWLSRTGRTVDVLSQADLEGVDAAPELARAYDLIVFSGHHEYVTGHEYDLVEGFRDLGGNLAFLSANNFYWAVTRSGPTVRKIARWRDLGRPEASLVGVQYFAHERAPRGPWVARSPAATTWLYRGTGLAAGARFGSGGIEIDGVAASSPAGVRVAAEIPDLFGPGMTAQMTYYETLRGARVFAAGAFYFATRLQQDPVTARVLANVWARLRAG